MLLRSGKITDELMRLQGTQENPSLGKSRFCPICMDENIYGGSVHTMCKCIPCNHQFCYRCLLKLGGGQKISWYWNEQQPVPCPLCRTVIEDFLVFNTSIQNHFTVAFKN